jgi:hypothetical protein
MARQDDVLTLTLFYVASMLTGNLAGQLRRRAVALRAIADRTNTLYDFSRKVASAAAFDDVVWAAVTHVSATLKCDSILLAPDEDDRLEIAGAFPPEDQLDVRDRSAADWAWERGRARRPRLGDAAVVALAVPAAGDPAGPPRRPRRGDAPDTAARDLGQDPRERHPIPTCPGPPAAPEDRRRRGGPRYIVNEPGVGYRIAEEPQAQT